MKKILFTKFLTLLAFFAAFTGSNLSAANIQQCLNAGGDPHGVIQICQDAILSWHGETSTEMLGEAYIVLGRMQMMEGDIIAAYGNAEKALTNAPRSTSARILLARIHMRNDNFTRAEQEVTAALERAKTGRDKGLAYYQLAVLYQVYGNVSRANNQLNAGRTFYPDYYNNYLWELNYFKDVILRNRAAERMFDTAKRQLAAGNPKEAIKSFELALSSDTQNMNVRNWLGSALVDDKNFEGALTVLNEVPDTQKWNYFIAVAYLNLEQYENAYKAFELAKNEKPPKNRGSQVNEPSEKAMLDISHYQSLLRKGQQEYQNKNYEAAVKFAKQARDIIQSKDSAGLISLAQTAQKEQETLALKQRQSNAVMVIIVISLILFVFAVYLLKYMKDKAVAKSNAKKAAQIASLNPIDCFNAYLDYRQAKPSENERVAKAIIPTIAKSFDYKLCLVFAQEMPAFLKEEFLIRAAENFIATQDPMNCVYGLLLLNQIPLEKWTPQITPIFIQGHLTAEQTILASHDPFMDAIWKEGIPADNLHQLLAIYYQNQQYPFVIAVFNKMPAYIWNDQTWQIYMDSQSKTGGLLYLNPENISRKFQPMIIAELFKHGMKQRIADFLKVISMATWAPDFFVYMFYFAVYENNFDEALTHYDNLTKNHSIAQATKQYYLIGILCEKAGHYDRAAEIYNKFLTLGTPYADAGGRGVKIGNGDYAALQPSPDQVLFDNGIYFSYNENPDYGGGQQQGYGGTGNDSY